MSNIPKKPSIRAKRNAVVFDYLLEDQKPGNEICSILDFCVDDLEAKRISDYFCNAVNQVNDNHKFDFKYEKSGRGNRCNNWRAERPEVFIPFGLSASASQLH